MKLLIGNKNYSSWSLRPWLLLRVLGIPFTEEKLSFNAPQFKAKVQRVSPAGKVPVLVDDDGTVVWDTLAIVEYLAERFPGRGVWPQDRAARATARSICAEMHAGFGALRSQMPMNMSQRFPGLGWNLKVQHDIDRILDLWQRAEARFGAEGPFLFGHFTAADAFYAPVVSRFMTHAVALPPPAQAYMAAIQALPAMQEWAEEAARENDFVVQDEPYRAPP
jgi:glutathione S-transferase